MGWLVMIGLAAVTGGALGWFLRGDRGALQFLAASLLLALAGYAWQEQAGLPGSPKAPPERQQVPDSAFAETREDMLGRFDRAWYWLNMSEGFARRGDTAGAAQVIRAGLRSSPNDPDLWVGYGSALVAHSDGMMTPAAEFAFRRAQELSPAHPAPRFYFGLALAQGGQFDQAARIWQQLLDEAPPEAEYRRTIEQQLAAVRQAQSMQNALPPPAAAQAQPAPAAQP
ncbi:MAG: tetratricopeptide repeat protein [Allosphingosinicella sp.]